MTHIPETMTMRILPGSDVYQLRSGPGDDHDCRAPAVVAGCVAFPEDRHRGGPVVPALRARPYTLSTGALDLSRPDTRSRPDGFAEARSALAAILVR